MLRVETSEIRKFASEPPGFRLFAELSLWIRPTRLMLVVRKRPVPLRDRTGP